jgi:hypothetical protein
VSVALEMDKTKKAVAARKTVKSGPAAGAGARVKTDVETKPGGGSR